MSNFIYEPGIMQSLCDMKDEKKALDIYLLHRQCPSCFETEMKRTGKQFSMAVPIINYEVKCAHCDTTWSVRRMRDRIVLSE